MQTDIKTILDQLQVLLAIETLEYHDKALLSDSDVTRSEDKQDKIRKLIDRVNALASNPLAQDEPCEKHEKLYGYANLQTSKMRQG